MSTLGPICPSEPGLAPTVSQPSKLLDKPLNLVITPSEYDSYIRNELHKASALHTEISVKETLGKLHLGLLRPYHPIPMAMLPFLCLMCH